MSMIIDGWLTSEWFERAKLATNNPQKFLHPLYFQTRHVKSTASDNGFSFHGRSLGIMSIGSQELLEYSEATRTEISCPMEFWNYPFDTQFCNFILEPLHFDFQLVNSDMISSSQFESQNIKMSYDIEIIPLPPELAVRSPPEVGLVFKKDKIIWDENAPFWGEFF